MLIQTLIACDASNLDKAHFKVVKTQTCSAICSCFEKKKLLCSTIVPHVQFVLVGSRRFGIFEDIIFTNYPLQTHKAVLYVHTAVMSLSLCHVCAALDALGRMQWLSLEALLRVLSFVEFFLSSLATVSPGFSDHVPAPCGNNLPHYLFLCEQHGTSGNSGHVPPWRSRRADRGEDVREN